MPIREYIAIKQEFVLKKCILLQSSKKYSQSILQVFSIENKSKIIKLYFLFRETQLVHVISVRKRSNIQNSLFLRNKIHYSTLTLSLVKKSVHRKVIFYSIEIVFTVLGFDLSIILQVICILFDRPPFFNNIGYLKANFKENVQPSMYKNLFHRLSDQNTPHSTRCPTDTSALRVTKELSS